MKKFAVMILILCFILPGAAKADNPLTKLGRGLTNIVTAPGEYITQMPPSVEATSDYLSALFVDIFRGTGFTVFRAVLGVYDVVTFPLPIPKKYEPLYEPETIFGDLF